MQGSRNIFTTIDSINGYLNDLYEDAELVITYSVGQKINGVEIVGKASGCYYYVKCTSCGHEQRKRADGIRDKTTKKCSHCPKKAKTSYAIDLRSIDSNLQAYWLRRAWK